MLFLKKVLPFPPLVLLRAKNDDVNDDDDVEEAAMMMTMTTTRGNPMNFYLARGLLFEKKNTLSSNKNRGKDRERPGDGTNTSSPLLQFFVFFVFFFVFFFQCDEFFFSAKERIEFLPRTRKKKLFVEQKTRKKPEDKTTQKKAHFVVYTHTQYTYINKSNDARNDNGF